MGVRQVASGAIRVSLPIMGERPRGGAGGCVEGQARSDAWFDGLVRGVEPGLRRNGYHRLIRQGDIKSRLPQKTSRMPSNYRDLLTQKQLADLLAYLVTLKGN